MKSLVLKVSPAILAVVVIKASHIIRCLAFIEL